MRSRIEPSTLRPAKGKILVKVVEKLAQVTPAGLIIPDLMEENQHLRDTATGKIVAIGPPPTLKHVFLRDENRLAVAPNSNGAEWPLEYLGLELGQYVVFPRDVLVGFTHEGEENAGRYAIVLQDELICSFESDDYDGESIVPPREEFGAPAEDADDVIDRDLEHEVERTLSKG